MIFGSLFSGIGGIDLGLERAGMECRWQVEINQYRRKWLERHWPDVPKFNDVKEVGKHDLEPVDLICGGFPCQDVSVAGRRAGLRGERTGLFFEFARILEEIRPAWMLLENVPGLFSSNGGRDFLSAGLGVASTKGERGWCLANTWIMQRENMGQILSCVIVLRIFQKCASGVVASDGLTTDQGSSLTRETCSSAALGEDASTAFSNATTAKFIAMSQRRLTCS